MERKSYDELQGEIAYGYVKAGIEITDDLLHHLVMSYYDIGYFNSVILGQPDFTYVQWLMGEEVVNNEIIAIVTGNMVGKSHFVAVVSLWHFFTRPDSITINTAPTANSVREVIWSKIIDFISKSRYKLPYKLVRSPQPKLSFDNRWVLIGISTNKIEKGSGLHSQNILALADEASGVLTEIFSALDSLGYKKLILTGNPLRTDGYFFETANKAARKLPGYGFLQIPSTAGPHAHLESSPFGLCDKSWLRKMESQYGKNTIWWQSHVEGKFPDSNEDAIIPINWLNKLPDKHLRQGPIRLGIDLASGSGGDKTVLCARDDNGIIELLGSNTWNLEKAAIEAKKLALKHEIEPRHIVFDAEGIGHDFNNRLCQVGLLGCKYFRPSQSGPARGQGERWRDTSLWRMRMRFDPNRKIFAPNGKTMVDQKPFFIAPSHLSLLRPELQGLSYSQSATGGKIKAKSKEELKTRLGHSPDYSDALMLTFAYDQ